MFQPFVSEPRWPRWEGNRLANQLANQRLGVQISGSQKNRDKVKRAWVEGVVGRVWSTGCGRQGGVNERVWWMRGCGR